MLLACLGAAGNPGAIFGLLAILCWMFLLCTIVAFPIVAVRKSRRGIAVLSTFLLGGLLAGALMWKATRPEGLSFRESLRAGLTDDGLQEYGHSIEHRVEVALCFSTYAWILGGGVCAGATLGGIRLITRRTAA
jgi:hypothetical protein